jgi:hypothetical protein
MVDRVSPLQSTCVAEVVHEHVDPHPLVEVSSDQVLLSPCQQCSPIEAYRLRLCVSPRC